MERIIIDKSGEPVAEENIRDFQKELYGSILWPSHKKYEDARRVWNASIDRYPAAIVRCEGVPDVNDAVNFARNNNVKVSVRGGGHGLAGAAVCDGGMVLDLSGMIGVLVDPKARTARAETGCPWFEFDQTTQAFGLATPGGVISTAGIAGHTLGGGMGWLVRKRGLTSDNVLSIDLVTADGQRVTASQDQNPDLFWGLRGGGGGLGVVTSFEYELYEQGPVLGGKLVYPGHRAADLLRFFRDFMADAPWELTAYASLTSSVVGEQSVVITLCYCDDPANGDEGERVIAPLRDFTTPTADHVKAMPYLQMQRLLDAGYPPGQHNDWRSGFLDELSDATIVAIAEQASAIPASLPGAEIMLEHYGGRASIPEPDATAFPHRRTPNNLVIRSRWLNPTDTDRHTAWVRDTWNALQPFTNGSTYLNYIAHPDGSSAQAAFGNNLERLMELRRKFDPDNLFPA